MCDILLSFNTVLAQASASLLAIIGMFGVFRLQVQENKLGRTYDSAKKFMFRSETRLHINPIDQIIFVRDPTAEEWLDKDVQNHLVRVKKDLERHSPQNRHIKAIEDYLQQINNQIETINIIKRKIKTPIILMAFLFIVSMLILPFSYCLISICGAPFTYMFIMIFLAAYTVILTADYIFRTMQDSKEMIINS